MKSIHKKIAVFLSLVLAVNSVPIAVFAGNQNEFETERGKEISFSSLVSVVDDYTTDVTVTVEKEINGEKVTTQINTTTDENVVFFTNGVNSKDSSGVQFLTGGDYSITKGIGTVNGSLISEADYNALINAANEKEGALQSAKEAATQKGTSLLTAQGAEALKKLAYDNAVKQYNDAVQAVTDAQTAYNNAVAALNNKDAAIAQKQAELDAELAKLAEKEQNLANAQTSLNNWKTENGYNSQADIQAAIDAKQAEYDAASGLNKYKILAQLTALKALPSVLKGLEDTLANQQTDVDNQKAAVQTKKDELATLSDEQILEMLQADITAAQAELTAAQAAVPEKEAAKATAETEYTAAQANTAAAQTEKNNADAAVATAEAEAIAAWTAAKDYILALTANDITFDTAAVSYTAGSVSYPYTVKVWDKLTVNVVDENNSIDTDPVITVAGADLIAGNDYKLYENGTATFSVPTVEKYRYAVTGAAATGTADEYSVGPVTESTAVTVTYTEIGASSVSFTNPAGATITVNDGSDNLSSGSNVKAGTTLTVTVTPDTGFTVTDVKVTDKNGSSVTLTNGTFKTNTTEEDAYTVEATVAFTGSVVNTGNLGGYVESVTITVDGNEYTAGDVIAEGGKTVVVSPAVKTGFKVNSMNVLEDATNDFDVDAVNDKFTFTAESGKKYVISFADEAIADIRSSIEFGTVTNATVEVLIEGDSDETVLTENSKISEINPGSLVTITVTPDANHYITGAYVNNNSRTRAVVSAVDQDASNNGVKVLKFRTTATPFAYTLDVTTATPIVAPNTTDVVINKYDIITEDDATVRGQLFSAFDKADGITELEYEYIAAVIGKDIINDEIANLLKMTDEDRNICFPIDTKITTASVKEFLENTTGVDLDNKLITAGLKLLGTSVDEILDTILKDIHVFGEHEEETVRAKFAGSKAYAPTTSASRTVKVQDLRTEVDVDINTEISVVYGSYASNTEILTKLLANKMGVNVGGTELDSKYDSMLSISKDLVGADVGTYSVEVAMADTDYDYKDTVKATATVTVTKADATVKATDNNVILFKNIGVLTKDYMVKVTPDVVINDTVSHISFLAGLDANTNDPAKPAIFATVDLSNTDLNNGIFGFNTADAFIKWIDSDGDGLTLEELLAKTDDIKNLIKSFGIDTELLGKYGIDTETVKTALKALYAALEEYSQYGDVYIKFVNDETQVVPDSHGIYIVGAVTADSNYNTAADASVVVISAEPVTVKFDDVNNNNARQFTYDGTQKAMTAKAYDESGKVIEGTMKYVYAGMQSDGTPYLNTEAPLHAGGYTVVALFNSPMYNDAGFAVGAMAIWPSDVAEVGVSNKVVVYDENNEVPVSVSDMITVLPEGTDAKVAVITAGIDVATDFSEEGLSALEGTVNIDFPERADTILKKIVPSAYTDTGITLATLKNKLAEIQTALADLGIDASSMDQIITALNELPDAAKLTFKNTYNGTVDTKALPRKIGAYLVTAVIFDPDYVPEVGAGVLLITPDITEATLSWTYDDMNGIITQPVLDKVTLSADAAVEGEKDAAATDMVKYLFVGLSKDGEIYTFTADQTDIAEVSKGLRNGAYTQIAYIWNGFDATMTVAQPIVREFVHVPQQMHIDFAPDANVDNVRTFDYTGKPIKMPVEVKKLDGSAVKDECLEIRYVGVDSQGTKYDSENAPTNVGTYVVTVTYKEYDVVPSYSLKYAGINVGVMVIEPLYAEVTVADKEYKCGDSCECECVKDGKVVCDANTKCACHKDSIADMITVTSGDYLIKVIADKDNNVNVILPAEWAVSASSTDVTALVAELISKIEAIEDKAESDAASQMIAQLIDKLETLRKECSSLSSETQDAIDEIIIKVKAVNTQTVKDAVKKVIEEIKASGISSDDVVAQAIKLLEEMAAGEKTSAEMDSLIAEVITLLNSVDTDAADEAVKAAFGAAVAMLREMDMTELKALASDYKAEIIDQLEAIDTAPLASSVDKQIADIISDLEDIMSYVENAENNVPSVTVSLKNLLNNIDIKTLTVNGKEVYTCGSYRIFAIAFGPNHIPSMDEGRLVIRCTEVVDDDVKPTPTPTPKPNEPTPTPTPKPNEPTPTPTPNPGSGSGTGTSSDNAAANTQLGASGTADTSDITNTAVWLFIAMISGATLIALIYAKRKAAEEQ